MDKRGFYDRLFLAADLAYQSAQAMLIDVLPPEHCFTIRHGTPKEQPFTFLGGRFLTSEDLTKQTAKRTAALLWVDRKVPAWINIGVCDYSATHTEIEIRFSHRLVSADENNLPTDYGAKPANEICPFRIRSPYVPADWRSVELDGKFAMMHRKDA